MADLFNNILSADESLFNNEMALDYDYLPKELPYREDQQHYIAECVQLLLSGKLGKNLLITGKPGIGKTAAARFVMREMEEKGLNEKAIPIYVNCWKKDTPYKILMEICNQLDYRWVQNKNTDELFRQVSSIINKKSAVIILDEVDKLESHQVIYQLLEDLNRKCVFLITNDENWIAEIDDRLRSRLMAEEVEFKPYNFRETSGILMKRARHAFADSVLDDEAFEIIAEKSAEKGDIRTGLYLLREAGNIAEKKASRKITKEHAEIALSKIESFIAKKKNELSEEEQEILELARPNSGKTSTEIYKEYSKNSEKSYRTFYRKLKALEENGFIRMEETSLETGGRTSKVYSK